MFTWRQRRPVTQHLPLGTWLDAYRIDSVLGTGGSGITYKAYDSTRNINVALKEYFPSAWAERDGAGQVRCAVAKQQPEFAAGLHRFIDEAQVLTGFNHPGIVRIERIFSALGTGYILLTYIAGPNLLEWQQNTRRRPRQTEFDIFSYCLLSALEAIHRANIYHCDIAPRNILLNQCGLPILIDFGSARHELLRLGGAQTIVVTPHYAAQEQYSVSGSQLGPWSDIYSAAAVLYFIVTGTPPQSAPSRAFARTGVSLKDSPGSEHLRKDFLAAIEWGLEFSPDARPRTIAEWRSQLLPKHKLSATIQGLPLG